MKLLVLKLLVGLALLDVLTDWLNWRRITNPRTRAYHAEHIRASSLEALVQLAFWVVAFHFPLLDMLDEWITATAPRMGISSGWHGAIWLSWVALARSLISLPFAFWSTFSIEQRYGFNRTSKVTFFLDRIKGLILSLLIGIPLLALVLGFFDRFETHAWWLAWITVTTLSLVLSYLAPMILLPFFNRFTPLPDGPLREAIGSYASREGFSMRGIFVMDGSRRSSKRNAFFTGFGGFKKLVLFDTLIEKHSVDEVVAIVAHEMGHFKLGHIPRMVASMILSQGILFFLMGRFLSHEEHERWVRETLLMVEPTLAAEFLLMSLLYIPLERVLSWAGLWMSRQQEYAADRYSAETFRKPEALIAALRSLQADHLSHPDPHPLKVWMEYSHPPVFKRARALGVAESSTSS